MTFSKVGPICITATTPLTTDQIKPFLTNMSVCLSACLLCCLDIWLHRMYISRMLTKKEEEEEEEDAPDRI